MSNLLTPYSSGRQREFISPAIVDALLEKLYEVMGQSMAWANLSKILLLRASYDSSDAEIAAAFQKCFPAESTDNPTATSTSTNPKN